MSKLNIILLSASLMALGAFSIDTILPSISYLKNEFDVLPKTLIGYYFSFYWNCDWTINIWTNIR